MSQHHGLNKPSGIEFVAHSRFHHGRFGRLFPNLDSAEYEKEALAALARLMVDKRNPRPKGGWGAGKAKPDAGDNPGIPAGYTYLGQFLDHDITFDPASSLLRSNDPDALHNFRTPRLDLDNVYGEGPADEPFMYDQEHPGKLLIGTGESAGDLDLPRNTQDRALIGDMRNDENVNVSQLQMTMLLAHNKLVDLVEPAAGVSKFDEARRQLRWHYQYVIVNDFLRRVVPDKVLKSLIPLKAKAPFEELDLSFFDWDVLPYMPVEFSVAAYRFGHSMIRPSYDVNASVKDVPIFREQTSEEDLRGFRRLPKGFGVEWSLFFATGSRPPQPSRLIDTKLAQGLNKLPGTEEDPPPQLALRNLLRGERLSLPSGEAVATRMGEEPLTTAQVGLAKLGLAKKWLPTFVGRTPLWFYILREAEVRSKGKQLGPVGGRIVGETLLGLVAGDQFAYPNLDPTWTPKAEGLVKQKGKTFEMRDLIAFATS